MNKNQVINLIKKLYFVIVFYKMCVVLIKKHFSGITIQSNFNKQYNLSMSFAYIFL